MSTPARASFATLLALCILLPGVARSECMVHVYKLYGTVVNAKGQPVSTPITFSWVEEYNGRRLQRTVNARQGRYTADIPFYTQAKRVPGVPVPGGALYACTAMLKTVLYTYASAPGKQELGDITLSGDETVAKLGTTERFVTPAH